MIFSCNRTIDQSHSELSLGHKWEDTLRSNPPIPIQRAPQDPTIGIGGFGIGSTSLPSISPVRFSISLFYSDYTFPLRFYIVKPFLFLLFLLFLFCNVNLTFKECFLKKKKKKTFFYKFPTEICELKGDYWKS